MRRRRRGEGEKQGSVLQFKDLHEALVVSRGHSTTLQSRGSPGITAQWSKTDWQKAWPCFLCRCEGVREKLGRRGGEHKQLTVKLTHWTELQGCTGIAAIGWCTVTARFTLDTDWQQALCGTTQSSMPEGKHARCACMGPKGKPVLRRAVVVCKHAGLPVSLPACLPACVRVCVHGVGVRCESETTLAAPGPTCVW
jgi:hypothetical protein